MAEYLYSEFDEYDDKDDQLLQPRRYPEFRTNLNRAENPSPEYQYFNSHRDLTLPLQKHKNYQPPYESPEEEISLRKYVGGSVGMVSLVTENLLSHPFVVLRRQCQVHHSSTKYHLVPVTLVPVIVHLHRRQGVTTLWKGLGSCLLVRGMSLAIEDAFTKFTPWPKEVNSNTTLKQFGQHLLLKCISFAVVLPFYAASLVETVQSDIASEKPGVFDVFSEGASRLLSWTGPQKGRMLPMWVLVGPSVGLGLTKYVFGLTVKGISSRLMKRHYRNVQERQGAKSRDIESENQEIEIYSTLISLMTTEILFYPFETILHRIQLQGTRTIIDNLDSGYSVVPILTSYEGAVDCCRTTVASEGVSGLYKGFGAMILQFVAHVAVIKITKWIVIQITELCLSKPTENKASADALLFSSAKESPELTEYMNYLKTRNSDDDSTTVSRSISSLSVE